VLVKTSSGIHDLPQLSGKRVLTVKGGTQEPNIRKAVPGVDVVTFETTQQAFLALQQGKGAGYVNDESTLINDYAKLGPAKKDYAILSQNISVEPLALGLRKGETALKTQVDDVLRELESSGEAEKLFFKWYGPSTKLQFDKRSFKIDSDKIAG
jgi:polar amino acid transport system substrate-binding protein